MRTLLLGIFGFSLWRRPRRRAAPGTAVVAAARCIDELVLGVNIALGQGAPEHCPAVSGARYRAGVHRRSDPRPCATRLTAVRRRSCRRLSPATPRLAPKTCRGRPGCASSSPRPLDTADFSDLARYTAASTIPVLPARCALPRCRRRRWCSIRSIAELPPRRPAALSCRAVSIPLPRPPPGAGDRALRPRRRRATWRRFPTMRSSSPRRRTAAPRHSGVPTVPTMCRQIFGGLLNGGAIACSTASARSRTSSSSCPTPRSDDAAAHAGRIARSAGDRRLFDVTPGTDTFGERVPFRLVSRAPTPASATSSRTRC